MLTKSPLQAEVANASFEQLAAMDGIRYLDFLRHLQQSRKPDWYLEIGTAGGQSLELSRAKSIAIDPAFRIKRDISLGKTQLHCFQITSDAFFAEGHAEKLGAKIDLAFLDGMHQFEFLLRDFMGTEKISKKGALIALHDCVPMSAVAAARSWDKTQTRQWTGDVWKVVPILRKYRPDLHIETVDCPPSGLVLITNLDPDNRVLDDAYSQIIAEFTDAALQGPMVERLRRDLNIISSEDLVQRHLQSADWTLAIKIPAPRRMNANVWGEFHFARSLAKAFEKRGVSTRIDCVKDWDKARLSTDVDLFLRGAREAVRADTSAALMWILSRPDTISPDEIRSMDHVFVASEIAEYPGWPRDLMSPLLHCTDADLFKPMPADPAFATDILFVGAGYPKRKADGIVAQTLRLGRKVAVYGRLWDDLPDGLWIGKNIANDQLAQHYASARVVLNDHHPSMRELGFVNNRIFDVLACGVPIVSDKIAGLPSEIAEFVYQAETDAELASSLDAALGEDQTRRRQRIEFAEYVRENYSFDLCAATIEAKLKAIFEGRKSA